MGIYSDWLVERHHRTALTTTPNGLVPMIAKAGPSGLTRKELRQMYGLPGNLLDRLLMAFVGIGQLTASDTEGG